MSKIGVGQSVQTLVASFFDFDATHFQGNWQRSFLSFVLSFYFVFSGSLSGWCLLYKLPMYKVLSRRSMMGITASITSIL